MVTDDGAPAQASGAKPQARPRHGPDRASSWHGEIAFAVPTSTSGTDAELSTASVAWSPDGRRLVYDLGQAGHPAFDCTAVLRCDTIGSLSAAPGEGALGFLVTVDHPARALVSVTRFGSTTGSVPLLRLPLYTCCMTWAPPAPGQTAV